MEIPIGVAQVHHAELEGAADLLRGQANAGGGVHGRDHLGGELGEGLIEDGHRRALLTKDGGVVVNNRERHGSVEERESLQDAPAWVCHPGPQTNTHRAMNANEPAPAPPKRLVRSAGVWPGLFLGVALILAAWVVPVNFRALAPALLERAGTGTPDLAALGLARLEAAEPGPAALLLNGARAAEAPAPGVDALAVALAGFSRREPALMPWGGEDPFLRPLMQTPTGRGAAARGEAVPVLTFLAAAETRAELRGFLAGSRRAAVRETLALLGLENTGRFVPAGRPGGQTYEALVLLAALLQQGEHFDDAFARTWRETAREATVRGGLGAGEAWLLDLLALARRLDWRQLTAVAGGVQTNETWAALADLARGGGRALDLTLAAALVDGSSERLVRFRRLHPADADADLALALAGGQGAVRLLLDRGVPVHRGAAPAPGPLVSLAVLLPAWALALRFALCAGGAYLVLRALDRRAANRTGRFSGDTVFRARAGLLALVATGVFAVVTEPYLGRGAPLRAEKIHLALPVLGDLADPATLSTVVPSFAMDLHSLLAIALFGALQIAMYLVCLAKIRAVDALAVPPLVKLRLMENEENLFDGGLYLGIGGTATALVLQVLGVVEPNLLAAYSSNLLGITCVALIKIRHVRPFKTRLILAAQDAIAAGGAPEASR